VWEPKVVAVGDQGRSGTVYRRIKGVSAGCYWDNDVDPWMMHEEHYADGMRRRVSQAGTR
jgi:hypothetical protein